jgi:hypothetical protein
MELNFNILSLLNKKKDATLAESIGDLKAKLSSGIKLSVEERTAINNYERYKEEILNASLDEHQFHNKYKQLQVIANLGDWREFLKEEYF